MVFFINGRRFRMKQPDRSALLPAGRVTMPRFAVNRPVTVLMATLAVTTFGLLAVQNLPVDLLPDLSYPTLTIQTEYPDAAPETVEQFITRPIEEAVGVLRGLTTIDEINRVSLQDD